MGQKIIPISLRLNKRKDWQLKWIVQKNEYSLFLFLNLEIKKYFIKFLNNKEFELINLNIKKNSKNINIYVYLNQKKIIKNSFINNKNIKKFINKLNNYFFNYFFKIFIRKIKINKIEIFKKNIIQKIFNNIKKKYKINFFNKQLIYNFSFALIIKNLDLILILIKKLLEKKKIHKKIIKNINNIFEIFFFTFFNIIGYKLQFKGRLNGYRRKKKIIFKNGKIPLNTLKYNIKYSFNEFKTPSGICSIKLWVFFKN